MDRAAGAPADPTAWSPAQVEGVEMAQLWWSRAKMAMLLFFGASEE